MASVFDPDFEPPGNAPAPFRARHAPVGRQAGARELGASVYELAAGESVCPLHIHHGNEEMLIVLAGRPVLRTLDARRELAPGEVVAFPAGREGAHRVDNDGPEAARVLILSTMRAPEVVEYPDSGKVMARTQAPGSRPMDPHALRLVVSRDAEVDYFEGEA